MAITILPLTEADLPSFVNIEIEAFRSHVRWPMLWPSGQTPDLDAFYQERKVKAFHDRSSRFVKAVNGETGEIVAASQWTFALDPLENAKAEITDPNQLPPTDWPEGGNWEMRQFFKIEWETWLRKNLAGKPYIVLDILVVNPQHQGRGIGAQLLSWGCEQADHHGVLLCLEASPAGLRLYERFGFREIRTLKADMKAFGWQEAYDEEAAKRVWMVREARSRA